jgi:hypothetical protein
MWVSYYKRERNLNVAKERVAAITGCCDTGLIHFQLTESTATNMSASDPLQNSHRPVQKHPQQVRPRLALRQPMAAEQRHSTLPLAATAASLPLSQEILTLKHYRITTKNRLMYQAISWHPSDPTLPSILSQFLSMDRTSGSRSCCPAASGVGQLVGRSAAGGAVCIRQQGSI